MPLFADPAVIAALQFWLVLGAHVFLGTATVVHALLWKRDSRAALGWIAVALLFPLVGALLYALFGINRVQTRARRLSGTPDHAAPGNGGRGARAEPDGPAGLRQVGERITGNPLQAGNRVAVLHNGEQAYPAMLEAIRGARERIWLATYIFDTDATGRAFIDALAERAAAGVDVRVLVDGMGELYSWPRASRLLRRQGVLVARFLPPRLLPPTLRLNLRTHRKLLVVDDGVGFAGGMNIGDRHLADNHGNPGRVVDLHLRFAGPVVYHLAALFQQDWHFCTGDDTPELRTVAALPDASAECRVLADGPNEDLDRLTMAIVGAVSAARERVRVMTPYFLPPRQLVGALQGAALRGVRVQVLLPGKNNLPYVDWASRHGLWELLEWGVEIAYQPAPFVHSKLLLVDDDFAQVGSANLDPRSLRLNFEVGVEVFDSATGTALRGHYDAAWAQATVFTLGEHRDQPMWKRLRNGAAALFSPYL